MAHYRNGLQIVRAAQWRGNVISEVLGVLAPGNTIRRMGNERLAIHTPQRETLLATPGDWVVLDAAGCQHVISDHVFKATTQEITQ